MKKRHQSLFVLSICLLMSCEQFLEVELPGQEPRLVLNSLMEPTDTLKVFLSQSKGILEDRSDDQFEVVKGAQVQVEDEAGKIHPLDYLERQGPFGLEAFYFLDNPSLAPGQSYEVTAAKDGFATVQSKEAIPETVQIKSIEMTNLGQIEGQTTNDLIEVKIKFEDPPQRDFYEISGEIVGQDIRVVNGDTVNFVYSSSLYARPANPIYERNYQIRDVILFRDNLLKGDASEMVFRISLPKDYDLTVTIRLSHVSESYFLYYDTSDLQWYNRGDFLSQPVLVYTNITNGLGIFKARTSDERVFEMRLED